MILGRPGKPEFLKKPFGIKGGKMRNPPRYVEGRDTSFPLVGLNDEPGGPRSLLDIDFCL